jgi:hypothetical protein
LTWFEDKPCHYEHYGAPLWAGARIKAAQAKYPQIPFATLSEAVDAEPMVAAAEGGGPQARTRKARHRRHASSTPRATMARLYTTQYMRSSDDLEAHYSIGSTWRWHSLIHLYCNLEFLT